MLRPQGTIAQQPRREAYKLSPGGATIAEVVRRAWSRLIRKQWLIVYPLAVSIIDALAFLMVYAANGDRLHWTDFFAANFDRWQYLRDHFFSGFSFTSTLGIAVAAGIVACLGAALIRAPYFRAIAGPNYPIAPRRWEEALNLFVFYVLYNLFALVVLIPSSTGSLGVGALWAVVQVILILVAFTDYVIVFEELSILRGLRRSLQLVRHRWPPVVIIFIVVYVVDFGFNSLYSHYYNGQGEVFVLLPVSQFLVQSLITLIFDLLLIFLYEDIRRSSPAG